MEADPRDQRIAQLEAENRQLREQLQQLQAQLNQALQRIDELERAAHRQAAPFRREPKKIIPPELRKRPGRKDGHEGAYRMMPPQIDQEIDVPLERCPRCGGALREVRNVEQVIEELEPVRPKVIKLTTRAAVCNCCGKTVGSHHPLQTGMGEGCAKVQLGPRALAVCVLLNKVCGLTMRKTTTVLKKLCGLRLTAGGLSQALCRVAQRLEGRYERLIEQVRDSPAVNADETSWYVGRPGFWLWCFTTPTTTVYRVDDSRGSDVVRDVLGEKFAGVLVSDCLASYNPIDCRKHKCFAHHLRAIASAAGDQLSDYLNQWNLLLKTAARFHREHSTMPADQFQRLRQMMETWKDRLLDTPVREPGDVKIRDRLIKHRPHLLRCLEEAAAEPTNNRAERGLRPAVIARKLSCGNRTERGKRAWEVLSSIGVSCQQRGQDLIEYLSPAVQLPAG